MPTAEIVIYDGIFPQWKNRRALFVQRLRIIGDNCDYEMAHILWLDTRQPHAVGFENLHFSGEFQELPEPVVLPRVAVHKKYTNARIYAELYGDEDD